MLERQSEAFEMTNEHEMLLRVRDTLYEGSWEDFVADLKAQAESRPYVFDVLPPSSRMGSTISRHLALIDQLQQWEASHDTTLQGPAAKAT
jgi:hypothetical protein